MPVNHNDRQERKRKLESAFEWPATDKSLKAWHFTLDVLFSNCSVIGALLHLHKAPPTDALDNDSFICGEICVTKLSQLIAQHERVLPTHVTRAARAIVHTYKRLPSLIDRVPKFVMACLLLEFTIYYVNRISGGGLPIPAANFPRPYLEHLANLAPPITYSPNPSAEELENCIIHLERAVRT